MLELEQNLLFEGYRVCSYSTQLETTISHSESKLNYQPRNDQTITIRLKLNLTLNNKNCYIGIFTTTPWTLMGNMAIAINQNYDYYGKNE